MKNFDFTKVLFLTASVLILIAGFIIPEGSLEISIIGGLSIICLVFFDIKAPKIVNLSEGNPKVKTIRNINRLTIFMIIIGSTPKHVLDEVIRK